jgi:D-hexose-6-phosphate mutarotase
MINLDKLKDSFYAIECGNDAVHLIDEIQEKLNNIKCINCVSFTKDRTCVNTNNTQKIVIGDKKFKRDMQVNENFGCIHFLDDRY